MARLAAAVVLALAFGTGAVVLRRRTAGRTRRVLQAIAHELRTPLAIMQSSSELLVRGNGLDAAHGRWVEVIARETQQLTGRIENLIVFAWAQRGELLVLRAPVDLGSVVRRCVEATAAAATADGATLRSEILDGVCVRGDASRLAQAVGNILDNALRFGPAGQTVDIGLERAGREAVLTISDQGPGVPERDRRRVWRPFARHDGVDSPPIGGTGLGLAVAHAIIAAHGGRATLDDAPGGGARVRVTLPLLPPVTPSGAIDPGRVPQVDPTIES